MAIAIYFHPQSMSAAQYDEAIKRLDAAGAGNPPGRLHHSAFGPPDQMMVFDVWTRRSRSRSSARPSCRSWARSGSTPVSRRSCPSTT